MAVFVSPSEPAAIKTLGVVSSVPETYGSDVLVVHKDAGVVGIQRKEIKDFVNSLHDGRFGTLLGKIKQCSIGILLVEGNWQWTNDGRSLVVPSFTLTQYRGTVFSLQSSGCWVITTSSMGETIATITQLVKWLDKGEHASMMRRPNPQSSWGRVTSKEWGCHLLSSFEGISHKLAGMIYDHFGGVPMAWTVDADELLQVPGIGKKRAEALLTAMRGADEV